jgi:hypothetical protein
MKSGKNVETERSLESDFKMRIKLNQEQLKKLAVRLPYEVVVDQPRDVRGLLEVLGRSMPWDETGLSKFGTPSRRPGRVTFSVEAAGDMFVCDVHPALAHYIRDILSEPPGQPGQTNQPAQPSNAQP